MTPLFAALALLAAAADEPKPNTLTPKEAAEGWLLLFDGATTFGWTIDGDAKVADGALVLGGDKASSATTTSRFRTYELTIEYRAEGAGKAPEVRLGDDHGAQLDQKKKWVKIKQTPDRTTWQYDGTGESGMGREPPTAPIRVESPVGTKLVLKSVKLKPTGLWPLFNGKDLTGWKRYTADEKRARTEFSVTQEGWLHLKNGPGDLQTEGLYDDFVLQVECKTNGDRLNSGVFFRCIPGEYQNGYEAQIHNGFAPDKPKEYTIDEYDPKTNELKDKKKAKYAAIDYGTGAIYRRIPARKQAAKDNEWFAMTVVADGRHIATWVNGVQTVDWTDNRPLKDNARNGCRLEKGAISLQGHDPTTDIDFRNLRLAELPKAK